MRRWFRFWYIPLVAVAFLVSGAGSAAGQGTGETATAAGIVFETLSPEDLDWMEEQIGYRAGVYVQSVQPGSAGAAAGIKASDVVIIIGETGVDNAQDAAAIVNGASGAVEVFAFTQGEEGYTDVIYTLTVSGQSPPAYSPLPTIGGGTQAAGMTLETLTPDFLDAIEENTGYRVGVRVTAVQPGSAASAAGVQEGDILLVVNDEGVASAEAAVAALNASTGTIEVMLFAQTAEGMEARTYSMDLGGGVTVGAGVVAGDPINAYYDMLDFVRSQAWGRTVSTPAAERQRVAGLAQEAMAEADEQTRASIEGMPQVWAALQTAWGQATEEQRAAQREYWRKYVLTPGQFLPPPAESQTYRSPDGTAAIHYPVGWIAAEASDDEVGYLFLCPPETEATWAQVGNAAQSPAGALIAQMPITDEMRALGSWVEGARWVARQAGFAGAPEMKEIDVLDLGQAAVITYLGRFPGQTEEKFFWVGVIGFGPNQVIAGRLGGPSAQAQTLVPAFHHMLNAIELKPPGGGGGGGDYASAMTGAMAGAAWNSVTTPDFSGQEFYP